LNSKRIVNLKFSQNLFIYLFLMVDSVNPSSINNSVKIAVVGNVDSGKSTLVGVLSKGDKDDGRGGARQKVFNFVHE
jgi:GTPase